MNDTAVKHSPSDKAATSLEKEGGVAPLTDEAAR